jgi:predicted nucleotidyltransferase component of viral defense system
LVGGTALSLQLKHRLSEDLDFMKFKKHKMDKMEVETGQISRELEKNGIDIKAIDILGNDQVLFVVGDGVKLSFYATQQKAHNLSTIHFQDNLYLADIHSIAALKMDTMSRRNTFRDYYDLYFILKEKSPEEIVDIVNNALEYSNHHFKSKNLLGVLGNYERFFPEKEFALLNPVSNISSKEIAAFMEKNVKAAYQLHNNAFSSFI